MGVSRMTFSDPKVLDAAVYGRIEGQFEFNMIVKSVIHILNLKCNIEIKYSDTNEYGAQSFVGATNSYASHDVYDYIPFCINSLLINEMS